MQNYIPIFVMLGVGVLIGIVFLTLQKLLGPSRPNPEKLSTYESGMPPIRTARERFSVKYYMVAVLFILFDIEIVFKYPWAVQFKELGSTAFIAMILFIVLLLAGYLYVIRKGALKWD